MGMIHTAASFRQTLAYCLEDKKLSLRQEQKLTAFHEPGRSFPDDPALSLTGDLHLSLAKDLHPSPVDEERQRPVQRLRQVAFKDRAEIFYYNQCYGTKQDLVRQFNEVARLKLNVSEPVFHISLSLPPGESLQKARLVDLALHCAQYLDFEKHQYVAVLHKDTAQQHFHLVANRIGFDGHTADDSFSYGRMADFCREAETRHNLVRELGPRRYLPKEERQVQRHGLRLDKLKEDITQSLRQSVTYPEFREQMQGHGYKVYDENRGIAFMDEKNVFFKGSEAGYSRHEIELTLEANQQLRQKQELKLKQELELKLRQRHRLSISDELGL